MAVSLIQKKGAQSGASVASLSVTLDAPPTPGNLLVACCNSDATVATPAGFTLAVSAVNFQGLYIFYRVVQIGDGATVTFAPSVSDSVAGGVLEYSGIVTSSPLDQTASNTTTTTASSLFTGAGGATAQANELIIVVVGPHSGSGHPWVLSSWSGSYVSQIEEPNGLNNDGLNGVACHIGDQIVSSIVTPSATGTWSPSASNAGAAIATFKAATGHTIAVGLASEADAAQQVRPQRSRTLGTAQETDAAFTIAHSKARTIGTAAETDTAFPITPHKSSTTFEYLTAGGPATAWLAGSPTPAWRPGLPRA